MTLHFEPHSPRWAAAMWLKMPNAYDEAVALYPAGEIKSYNEDELAELAAKFETALGLTIGPAAAERGMRLEVDKRHTVWGNARRILKPRYGEAADLTSGMRVWFSQHVHGLLLNPDVAVAAEKAVTFDFIRLPAIRKTQAAALAI